MWLLGGVVVDVAIAFLVEVLRVRGSLCVLVWRSSRRICFHDWFTLTLTGKGRRSSVLLGLWPANGLRLLRLWLRVMVVGYRKLTLRFFDGLRR